MECTFCSTTLALICGTVILIFIYFKYAFSYWKRRGVPYLKPQIPFGNMKKLILGKENFGCGLAELYKKVDTPYAGYYISVKPALLIKDPELIKKFLIKEFSSFSDRGVYYNEEIDPLTAHLFTLRGQQWRNLRTKMTPTFTSGKMKMMFPTIEAVGKELEECIDSLCDNNKPIDMKDVFARFTTDIIASCVFGIECNSIKNPNAEFRRIGDKLVRSFISNSIVIVFGLIIPSILKSLGIRIIDKKCADFFMDILEKNIKYREEKDFHRKDFMELFIRLKNNENINDEALIFDSKFKKENFNEEGLTFNQLAAQAFVFFVAGFETSSTTSAICTVELAKNMDVQDKLRNEINDVLSKNGNKLTYEAVMDMKYLDKVVNETLRKHPIAPQVFRVCRKKCELEKGLIIEEGTFVWISLLGLHWDPKYYPDPEKFDPERFSEEEKLKRHPFVYLPFGEGPRMCIGNRFALLQTKMALISALRNYRFETVEGTKITWTTRGPLLVSSDPILLNSTKITN